MPGIRVLKLSRGTHGLIVVPTPALVLDTATGATCP